MMTDVTIRERAAELVRTVGPNRAAKMLGTNRMTVLSLAAGAPVMPGTFALIRERTASLNGGGMVADIKDTCVRLGRSRKTS